MRPATAPPSDPEPTRTSTPLVAHVVPEYLPRSATFIHTLLRHQRRHTPLVLTQATSHLDEFPLGSITVHSGNSGARRFSHLGRAVVHGQGSAYADWIADQVRLAGCDLIHAHFGWSGRDAVHASTRLGVPLVTTFYGRDLSEARRARIRNPYRRLFAGRGLFIVEGPAMAEHLAQVGCPAARIRVVPIGIALEQFPFFPRRPRQAPLVVVQTGRFVEKKGFDVSVRAYAAARQRLGESELWLIGDGPLRDELEALVDRLGVRSSVRFAGMVSHEEYRQLMHRADVCLQPSRTAADGDTEGGAPTVILEMQALGIPVVATKHADIPFVVARATELQDEGDVDGVADRLVAVALEDEADRRARAEEAREFVEKRHSAVVTTAAVERVYDEALV